MYEFFPNAPFFNFELTRILSSTPRGGSSPASFLDALSHIRRNDPQSWTSAWTTQARKAESLARSALAAGQPHLAHNAYLTAANYFRASQYMLFSREEKLPLLEQSIACFAQAMDLSDAPVHRVAIPYEKGGGELPGYLYLPSASPSGPPHDDRREGSVQQQAKTPLLLVCGGADSTKEELHFVLGAAGPEHGYAVLAWDGPGQGISHVRDRTVQRADWEVVVGAVLDFVSDYAASHPEAALDLDRIAIAGASMGGYYALRGAGDARIKACVAVDAFYDLWELVVARMPRGFMGLWEKGWIPDWVVDGVTGVQGRVDFQSRWEVWCSGAIMGVSRPSELMRKMREWTFRMPDGSDFLGRVTCPVLVSGAADSIYFKPELSAGKIMECLTRVEAGKKECWIPKEPADGGLQAKVGAWNVLEHRTFKFLDQHFGIQRAM